MLAVSVKAQVTHPPSSRSPAYVQRLARWKMGKEKGGGRSLAAILSLCDVWIYGDRAPFGHGRLIHCPTDLYAPHEKWLCRLSILSLAGEPSLAGVAPVAPTADPSRESRSSAGSAGHWQSAVLSAADAGQFPKDRQPPDHRSPCAAPREPESDW
jgi:hypothetical protein